MTQLKKVVTVCDRCSFGADTPAEDVRLFAIEDRYYRLDLCEAHADAFDREVGAWARLAAEVDAPDGNQVKASVYFTERRREETARIRELRERAQEKALAEQGAAARLAELAAQEARAEETHARLSIPGALSWALTDHARERMTERGFTIADVLGTVAHPGHIHRQPWRGPDMAVYQRGTCRVVVNDLRRVIITVVDRDLTLETGPTPPPTQASPTERTAP